MMSLNIMLLRLRTTREWKLKA